MKKFLCLFALVCAFAVTTSAEQAPPGYCYSPDGILIPWAQCQQPLSSGGENTQELIAGTDATASDDFNAEIAVLFASILAHF
jgi:hypothetical protein